MRFPVVGTIYRRELRDVLRDRRTLFTMLVLPVLMYPALVLGFSQLTVSQVEKLRERTYPVMISLGGEVLLPGAEVAEGSLAAELIAVEQFELLKAQEPEKEVDGGGLLLAVDIPRDAEHRLARGEEVVLEPYHRSAGDASRTVWTAFMGAVERYRESIVPLRVDRDVRDLSSSTERGWHLFGGMLAMMVIMMAMTGAFYPALDVAAGEKERGTLETLLLSPASRAELVAGKYLTVLSVAVVAALMNLVSMALTFSGFSSMLPSGPGSGSSFGISLPAFAVILVGLIIMASLFSAVCLALSTFARTYKEGQAYLTPALLVVMPLAMVGLLPNLTIDPGMALLPVANMALLMKGLLQDQFPPLEITLTLLSLGLLSIGALAWSASLFNREEVLFREGKQVFGLRPPPGVPRPERPSVGVAVLGLLLGLAWMYYAGGLLLGAPAIARVVVPQLGLAVVAIALPRLAMVRLRKGLGLRPPPALGWVAGVLIGVGGVGVSLGLGQIQEFWFGPAQELEAELEQVFEPIFALGLPMVILCLGVLPGIAEELLFRGLVFQGARSWLPTVGAVMFSAVAFGLFHLSLHRFFPQMALGILLGYLVVQSRSVLPAMLAHAIHNGILVSAVWFAGAEAEGDVPVWVYPVGVVLVTAGLFCCRGLMVGPVQPEGSTQGSTRGADS